MLPYYLTNDFGKKARRASEEVRTQQSYLGQLETVTRDIKNELKKEEQNKMTADFNKMAKEIGNENALFETDEKINQAVAEAKAELRKAIVYKK